MILEPLKNVAMQGGKPFPTEPYYTGTASRKWRCQRGSARFSAVPKIFLDSCDPAETQAALTLLGKLDGQTTNPTLVAKNPYARERFLRNEKFTKQELMEFYKNVILDISRLIPKGSVSIEVYADQNTSCEEIISQAREMWRWIDNAHIKLPCTKTGITSAKILLGEGMRVNMTLCFSQEQAAAVYSAFKGASRGSVFLSPFVGRLDDIGFRGMDLIANILKMYEQEDSNVEVLTASVRSVSHMRDAVDLNSDIITAPLTVLNEWRQNTQTQPQANLKPIPYKRLNLSKSWESFDINHELTDRGIDRFVSDWNSLIC